MVLLVGLPESVLMDESGFSSVDIIPPWLSELIITWRITIGPLMAVVQ
jgi:hypothetical protein